MYFEASLGVIALILPLRSWEKMPKMERLFPVFCKRFSPVKMPVVCGGCGTGYGLD